MSADLLRRAAAKMRENAESATPGAWMVDDWKSYRVMAQDPESILQGGRLVALAYFPGGKGQDAPHIASWHPDVALAVAKAIDDVATAWEIADEANDGYVYDPDDDPIPFADTVDAGWVAVARAYLGEVA